MSNKQHMMPPPRLLLLLLLPVLILAVAAKAAPTAPTPKQQLYQDQDGEARQYGGLECLTVPNTVFARAVMSTLTQISRAASAVSRFSSYFGDFRLWNAINDCLDLLDLSNYELSRTLSASQTGKTNGTGRTGADLKTWLSAALINQDTCIDGFEGTTGFVKDLVADGLDQISSLVRQVLYMVEDDRHGPPPRRSSNGRRNAGGRGRARVAIELGFPHWISHRDRNLLQDTTGLPTPDAVVALDGTGNFTKIMDAVSAAPDHGTKRFVIYIKKGVYHEYVDVKRKKTNVMVYGDGVDVTIITGHRSNTDGWTTYRTATFAVTGAGFIARDLTIQNTAGPQNHQAVAFRCHSDLSAMYRCAFRGYQDTLYAHANRQFYRECTITGTVDFIFGDAVAVFQNCLILARQALPKQKNTVTAQGRKDPAEVTGFSFQFCNISADRGLAAEPPVNATPLYLGRPWKPYSRTVIMQSYLGDVVRPEGWLEWNGTMSLDTLYYAEYINYGPGAANGSRVDWPGYHLLNNSAQAENFTVAEFLGGNLWLPQTGVRYRAGLTV